MERGLKPQGGKPRLPYSGHTLPHPARARVSILMRPDPTPPLFRRGPWEDDLWAEAEPLSDGTSGPTMMNDPGEQVALGAILSVLRKSRTREQWMSGNPSILHYDQGRLIPHPVLPPWVFRTPTSTPFLRVIPAWARSGGEQSCLQVGRGAGRAQRPSACLMQLRVLFISSQQGDRSRPLLWCGRTIKQILTQS